MVVVVGGGHQTFFLIYYHLASASLLTAAWIVDGVSFRVADLSRSVIIISYPRRALGQPWVTPRGNCLIYAVTLAPEK